MDRAVRAAWTRQRALGFTTPGMMGFVPHLTLGLYDEVPTAQVPALLSALASDDLALRVAVQGVAAFHTDPGVVFVKLEASKALRSLHQQLQASLLPVTRVSNPHYAPGVWVPHITLADRVDAILLERSRRAAAACNFPATVGFCALRLQALHPARTLHERRLPPVARRPADG